MLKPTAFANSLTVVGLGTYVICRILVLVAPYLLFTIGQSWLHTLNLSSVRATVSMDIGTFLLGAVTISIFVWIASYVFASLYNRLAKQR